MTIKPGIDVKLELLDKSPAIVAASMQRLTAALIDGHPEGVFDATNNLARLLGQTMALADVIGRYRTTLEAESRHKRRMAAALRADRFSCVRFDETPIFPETAFTEAFEDLLSRDPRIAKNADEIRRVYATHGFALRGFPLKMALRTRMYLTKEIQKSIASLGAAGTPPDEAKKIIARKAGFTDSYAQTVYRTNLATCFTAGRFKQLEDRDVAAIAPALRFMDVGDINTREHHHAARGLIAAIRHAVWGLFSPPIGFNCRCDTEIMDIFDLREQGLIKRNGEVKTFYPPQFRRAHPDSGFKVARADEKVYS